MRRPRVPARAAATLVPPALGLEPFAVSLGDIPGHWPIRLIQEGLRFDPRLGLCDAEDDLVKRLLVDGVVEQSASMARIDQPAPQRLGEDRRAIRRTSGLVNFCLTKSIRAISAWRTAPQATT